nr:MAG TPA: hypothetical protein [Caudoviricetes sp.]
MANNTAAAYPIPSQYIIDNDDILSVDFYNNKQKIGVTLNKYQELEDICNTYYDKLVELGAIKKPKTAEELAAEQTEIISQLVDQNKMILQQMQSMQIEMEALKNVKSGNSSEAARVESRKHEKINR